MTTRVSPHAGAAVSGFCLAEELHKTPVTLDRPSRGPGTKMSPLLRSGAHDEPCELVSDADSGVLLPGASRPDSRMNRVFASETQNILPTLGVPILKQAPLCL